LPISEITTNLHPFLKFTPLLIFLSGCAVSRFERGVSLYREKNYEAAIENFSHYHRKNPDSLTALYYLYSCYRNLNQEISAKNVLEELAKKDCKNENVYLNLIYYYKKNRQYHTLFELLSNLPEEMKERVDEHYILTRGLYAEIICGAANFYPEKSDPIPFAIAKGWLPKLPDNGLYESDTITEGNLIILLDRQVEPIYPARFYQMKFISNHSFLYLPYMRLCDLGILEFDPELNPTKPARLGTTVRVLKKLKKRGIIE
jgi:tetratricopeptide (TPR) repeat protein